MPPKATWSIADADYAFELYSSGLTLRETAEVIGCSQGKIRNMFSKTGRRLRTNSEAAEILGPDGRKDRARAANLAASRSQTLDHRIKIANSRERNQSGVTKDERFLSDNLSVPTVLQKAVGKYNVDIMADNTIAMELFGGLWHQRGRHALRHVERFEHIFDSGFDVLIIWSVENHPIIPKSVNGHVVSMLKFRKRNPTAFRQCRVIWGTGELWGIFCKKHIDETSIVPSLRSRPHRFCTHKCVS